MAELKDVRKDAAKPPSEVAEPLIPPRTPPSAAKALAKEVLELAIMCARNARFSSSKEVAHELWKMAQESAAEAA